jgi:Tfp pilus assembly protein PilE
MTRTQKIVLGFVIGVVVCLFIAGILLGAAHVGWKSAVRAGNEAATIQNLKTIGTVERQYYVSHGRKFGTFEELVREQLVDARFRDEAAVVDGYVLTLTINPTSGNTQPKYVVTADPQQSSTGINHFYRDSSSDEIRVNPDHWAGPNAKQIGREHASN